MLGLLMPKRGGLMEHLLDGFIRQLLSGLSEGAGNNEGPVAWQQDIELIGHLSHGDPAKQGHADDGP